MDKYLSPIYEMFADQFEPVDDFFVYRRSSKAPPVKISKKEYELFISQFRKHLRYIIYIFLFCIISLAIFSVFVEDGLKSEVDMFSTYVTWLLTLIFSGAIMSIWQAPARVLKGRSAIGAPRSRREVKRQMLDQISYGFIACACIFAGFFVYRNFAIHEAQTGWHRLSVLGGLIIIAAFVIIAFQKWRSGRGDK